VRAQARPAMSGLAAIAGVPEERLFQYDFKLQPGWNRSSAVALCTLSHI